MLDDWGYNHIFPNYCRTGKEKSLSEVIKPDKRNSIWKVIESGQIKSRFYLSVKADKPADEKFIVCHKFTDGEIPLALLGIEMDYKTVTPYAELSNMFFEGKGKQSSLIIYYNTHKLVYPLSQVPCLTAFCQSTISPLRPLPEKRACIVWGKGDILKIDFDFWDGEYRFWVCANIEFGVLGE